MSIAFWCLIAGGLLPVAIVLMAKTDPNLDVYNPRNVHETDFEFIGISVAVSDPLVFD